MTIRADSQILEPGSKVRLFKLDATMIDPTAGVLFFHPYNQEGIITWQGVEYHPWPIEADGFEQTGDRPPTPSLSVANVDQTITAMCLQFDDLVGAVLTRKSTLSKYLDAVNFSGGVNPTANPNEHFPDEIWFLDRKENEDRAVVKWSLSSALDFNGVVLPGRIIVANQCSWQYRSAECGYAGGPVAKYDDTPTSNPALDNCSRRVSGCKLRFGEDNPLPYGSFPAAGLMRT
jgi:lambda-like phage minor tail protein L